MTVIMAFDRLGTGGNVRGNDRIPSVGQDGSRDAVGDEGALVCVGLEGGRLAGSDEDALVSVGLEGSRMVEWNEEAFISVYVFRSSVQAVFMTEDGSPMILGMLLMMTVFMMMTMVIVWFVLRDPFA